MAEDYKPQVRSLIDSDNPDIVGWHSTSVESILEAAKTGKLPGYDEKHTDDPDSSIKGLLLFTPLREQFEGTEFYAKLVEVDEDDMFSAQEMYAQTKAFVHYLVKELGFMPQQTDLVNLSCYDTPIENETVADDIDALIQESAGYDIKEERVRQIINSGINKLQQHFWRDRMNFAKRGGPWK